MAAFTTLNDLFVKSLQETYYTEKCITKALPKMAKAVGEDSKLGATFTKHFKETQAQVERLEKVFAEIGEKPAAEKSDAIEAIKTEAEQLMEEVDCEQTLTAGLLAAAQAVEHYEIARYGTLAEWAKVLGYENAAMLLEETLAEEKHADLILTELAIEGLNQEAMDAQLAMGRNDQTIRHSRQVV